MARGGRRSGRSGASYPNRSDLQNAPRLAPPEPVKIAPPAGSASVPPAGGTPPPLTPLDAPTQDNRPIQAGLRSGPGPGPEALGMALTPVDHLKIMYQRFPNPDLLELIIRAES